MSIVTTGPLRAGVVAAALASTPAHPQPFAPAADDHVLERVSRSASAELRALARQRARLVADPADLDLALGLARAYLRLARQEGDPRYEGYAQAALAPWWELAEPPVPVLLLRANLQQRRHAFEAALADLDRVLARAPDHPQAWLSRAMILAVQGQPHEALDACRRLEGGAPALLRAGCEAHAGGLGGRRWVSYQKLSEALQDDLEGPPEVRQWALTILGELAWQRADGAAAERHFRQAMAVGPPDPYLLGAYADLLLDEGRAAEARTLLGDEAGVDPLLLRLALAEQQLGDPALDGHVARLAARFAAARRRGDTVHLREEARFTLDLLDRAAEALELARRNWASQREPADARLLLEAALAAGQPGAARPVLVWLEQTGLEHVRIEALASRIEGAA